MRVIQYGPKEEEIVCNHCGSLLAYTEKDEYWERDNITLEMIIGNKYLK